ncbi:MAG: lactonase family protein [Bacteroidales bacterium]
MKKLIFLFLIMVSLHACTSGRQDLTLLAGTYTTGDSHGIYTYGFDLSTGDFQLLDSTASVNPSFLAVSTAENLVYAVNESGPASGLAVFIADRKSGKLTPLRFRGNPGADPCHVAVEPSGRYVVTADYSSGTVTVFSPEAETIRYRWEFTGSGPDTIRQKAPHIHCVVFSPDGSHLFATDLGTDRIYVFSNRVKEAPVLSDTVTLEPGSGPRHLVFNKKGDRAYLVNELSGMVTVFTHQNGKLDRIQSVTADTLSARGSAHIALSADGNFLYASTRLKGDGLITYIVDDKSGMLTRAGFQPTGSHPRHFLITPDDHWILVSCKNENHIEIYRRNRKTGLPEDTGKRIPVEQPVCLLAL